MPLCAYNHGSMLIVYMYIKRVDTRNETNLSLNKSPVWVCFVPIKKCCLGHSNYELCAMKPSQFISPYE